MTDVFYDPVHVLDDVHNYIEIPLRIKKIIDTPEFQRLRELKQLGTTYYVFPGASHNRFEHSLGVMHLASKFMKHLQMRQPELNIDKHLHFCVSAAGLLHDIGHGPFSHVFDNVFVPSILEKLQQNNVITKFRHEDMSVKLIAKLFADNELPIKPDELLLIQALVSPSTHTEVEDEYRRQKKGFIFELIANEMSGIDVDKWDYMLRDSRNCNLGISFNYQRLLQHSRVINDHICYHEKTSYELYLMFRTRYELFKRVYTHKASKAVEYMISDILTLANDVFHIIDGIYDPSKYMQLTDNIISRIQWSEKKVESEIANANMDKAKELIKRLHLRKLYKCVGFILLVPSIVADNAYPCLNNNQNNSNLSQSSSSSDCKINLKEVEHQWKDIIYKLMENRYLSQKKPFLGKDEIIIQLTSLGYGLADEHPIEKIFLYHSGTPNECHRVKCDQITHLSDSKKFREIIFRMFVKNEEVLFYNLCCFLCTFVSFVDFTVFC